ncbi:hypothetical protein RJT34_13357 [Clitoria ternatea]|uniref:Uncharacterized protein n=1 Tax=Clitoria ternatea TaxID=43366 RepID=A0AAN9JRD7_CLITE
MSGNIKVEVVERKCIKPWSGRHGQVESFKLSLLDQLSPNIHGNMTLFYPHNPTTHFSIKLQLLQNSLSKALTIFYPFAGRLQHPSTIHCNDQGAIFIHSRTDTSLSDILNAPNFDNFEPFLPTTDNQTMADPNPPMLLVRFTSFGCGATAITISLSHKIADMASVIAFLKTWTAVCGGATAPAAPELAIGATLFPPREIPGVSASVKTSSSEKFTTRRFVFEASKVIELKNRVKSAFEGSVFEPSRVEVVLALIWKCALLAYWSRTASFKRSVLFQAVNLRPRMEPAIPESAVGNFVWAFAVTVEEEGDVELHVLVKKMREGMRKFEERLKEEGGFISVVKEGVSSNSNSSVVYKCSSWCKFPVLDADFGWGKPVWMCSVNNLVSNTIALLDTKDGGGVEAFVTLDHYDITLFQQHQELLHYALLNPALVL